VKHLKKKKEVDFKHKQEQVKSRLKYGINKTEEYERKMKKNWSSSLKKLSDTVKSGQRENNGFDKIDEYAETEEIMNA
jgi:predicted proteasome-type protease